MSARSGNLSAISVKRLFVTTILTVLTFLPSLPSAGPAAPQHFLLLPSPDPPTEPKAQERLLSSLRLLSSRMKLLWSFGSFDPDSPSLQRAIVEGKINPQARRKPHLFAKEIREAEAVTAALTIAVLAVRGDDPVAALAILLSPVEDKLRTDLSSEPIQKDEATTLAKLGFSEKYQEDPSLILSLRIVRWLERSLRAAPEPETSPPDLATVEALIAANKKEEALKALSDLIAANPQEPILYLKLGDLYLSEGRWDDACLEYRRAVQLKGDLWEAWKGLARAEAKRKRYGRVLEAVRRVRGGSAVSEEEMALGAEAAFSLAAEAFRRGRDRDGSALYHEAEEWDRELIARSSRADILSAAVRRLFSRRRYEDVILALEKIGSEKGTDRETLEIGLESAVRVRRYDLAYSYLAGLLDQEKGLAPSLSRLPFYHQALDQEAVRLFEMVRNRLEDLNQGRILRQDLLKVLEELEERSANLLKRAYRLRVPLSQEKLQRRRLMSYELFQQGLDLLRQWVTNPDELTYRRSVILFEFARLELESAQPTAPGSQR